MAVAALYTFALLPLPPTIAAVKWKYCAYAALALEGNDWIAPNAHSPAEAQLADVANAATLAFTPIVLVEDRG